MPLGIFRLRTLTGANIVGLLLGAAIFSMFFFLSLYMQQVLGYSALKSGFAYLLVAVTIILAAGASQALVTRFGVKTILAIGMALLTLGLLYFTQIDVDGSYLIDLVPGFLLAGVGLGLRVRAGVDRRPPGRAAARGRARLRPDQHLPADRRRARHRDPLDDRHHPHRVASSRDAGRRPSALPGALTEGFQYAFAVGAGMAVIGLIATLLFLDRNDVGQEAHATAEAEASS